MEEGEIGLSPAARLFQSPSFNLHIISIFGSTTPVDPSRVILGLQTTLIHHPRFSSIPVVNGRKTKWVPTSVKVEDHIIIPELDQEMESPDQFIEDYISHLTTIPMDMSKPLWEVHLLNLKTTEAESIGILKIHHSMGDGASLMSLLLACTRKTSDPDSLPSVPVQKKRPVNNSATQFGGFWRVFLAIWMSVKLSFNTLVDLVLFASTIVFLKDTKTALKGSFDVHLKPKRLVYRSLSLDDIKLIKDKINLTVNDVILGVTLAALSRYLNRESGENNKDEETTQEKIKLQKNPRVRATVLVNLRPTPGIQKLAELMENKSERNWGWGNKIAYVMLQFKIGLQNDPLDYMRMAKAAIDRKKLSLEAICTYKIAKLVLLIFGVKVASAIAHRFLSNTTLAFSNVVGPLEEISFYGHPIAFLAPSVYGHPHALTVHFQSYGKKMTVVLAVDPDVIPHPHNLLQDFEESLLLIRDALTGLDAA